eukprot:Tbor_TRINITY_DN3831_c0_g1::TRINITY_DN3831_c0_g1_i1::g.5698::m.5698
MAAMLLNQQDSTISDTNEALMKSTKPAQGLRYAEKDRKSTCTFADTVAIAAIKEYKKRCPLHAAVCARATEQTVLAAFLVTSTCTTEDNMNEGQYDSESTASLIETKKASEGALKTSPPRVVSFGVGTKFIREELKEADTSLRTRVHDGHAEILARRAFERVLIAELQKVISGEVSFLLERNEYDSKFSNLPLSAETYPICLKKGIAIHLYTSSTPCGNSAIRRWASGKPEPAFPEYEGGKRPNEWPSIPHKPINIGNRHLGQLKCSVKRDIMLNYSECPSSTDIGHNHISPQLSAGTNCQVNPDSELKGNEKKNMNPSDWCSIGTAPTHSGQGSTLTCSDKIALWNAVGVQGKRLMATGIMPPVYLDIIVVGRKFSRMHLQRAVCCRLQELPPEGVFSLHHPTVLRSGIKLNEDNVEQDSKASFSNNTCIYWSLCDDKPTFIDGSTGMATLSIEEAESMESSWPKAMSEGTPLSISRSELNKSVMMMMSNNLDEFQLCRRRDDVAIKVMKKRALELMESLHIPQFAIRKRCRPSSN